MGRRHRRLLRAPRADGRLPRRRETTNSRRLMELPNPAEGALHYFMVHILQSHCGSHLEYEIVAGDHARLVCYVPQSEAAGFGSALL